MNIVEVHHRAMVDVTAVEEEEEEEEVEEVIGTVVVVEAETETTEGMSISAANRVGKVWFSFWGVRVFHLGVQNVVLAFCCKWMDRYTLDRVWSLSHMSDSLRVLVGLGLLLFGITFPSLLWLYIFVFSISK